MPIRIASKSIRSRWVLRYLLDKYEGLQGLMCFTAEEAIWLSQNGFDDLLIAYPFWEKDLLRQVAREIQSGKRIICMVDSPQHIARIQAIGLEIDTPISVCLDLDLSLKLPGLHFGVFRSPITSAEQAKPVFDAAEKASHVNMMGLMGYEAQVAGVGDRIPGMGIKAPIVRLLKKRSISMVRDRRKAVVDSLRSWGADISLVNGGGTGSMESTCREPVVTEVTAGSGFFASHLFDYYDNFQHLPAAGYACRVVRQPQPGIYTCLGGGYVASGSTGIEKQPLPYLPQGATLHSNEGAGEVQTPVLYKGKLQIGDPVFFRHSKAGELCERFNELAVIEGDQIVDRIPTYRGEGKCFL